MIQLKTCPRCKKSIRRSLRYGNIIKQQLLDIEKVKAKVNGNPVEIEAAMKDLETSVRALKSTLEADDEKKDLNTLMRRVTKLSNMFMAAVTKNQVMLMKRFAEINQKLKHRLFFKAQSQVSNESRVEGTYASFFFFSLCINQITVNSEFDKRLCLGKIKPFLVYCESSLTVLVHPPLTYLLFCAYA